MLNTKSKTSYKNNSTTNPDKNLLKREKKKHGLRVK